MDERRDPRRPAATVTVLVVVGAAVVALAVVGTALDGVAQSGFALLLALVAFGCVSAAARAASRR